jgi:hypothetical protein
VTRKQRPSLRLHARVAGSLPLLRSAVSSTLRSMCVAVLTACRALLCTWKYRTLPTLCTTTSSCATSATAQPHPCNSIAAVRQPAAAPSSLPPPSHSCKPHPLLCQEGWAGPSLVQQTGMQCRCAACFMHHAELCLNLYGYIPVHPRMHAPDAVNDIHSQCARTASQTVRSR